MLTVPGGTRRGVHWVLTAAGAAAVVIAGAAAPAAAAPAAGQLAAGPSVFAWGDNENGQLGNGTTISRSLPAPVTGLPAGVQQVALGTASDFGAALLSAGTVSAWGANNVGQLGDGSTTERHTPVPVTGLAGITQISAGGGHMLAVGSGGAVWSWGFNNAGQLGNGTSGTSTDIPAKVPGLTGITQVVASNSDSFALRSDGTVWAWGNNLGGQLGDGSTVDRAIPEHVPGLTGITQIASGTGISTFAVRSDGTLFAWGANAEGQLGDGSTVDRATPERVPGLTGVTQVSSSGLTTLAIAGPSATVWGWGSNGWGEIGDGTTTSHASPEQLALTGVTQVSAGWFVSAAVRSDGTLLTWGNGFTGDLGIGTTGGYQASPVQVTSLAGVSQVRIGNGVGMAIGRPAPVVPDVRGETPAGASQVLQAAGFVLGKVSTIIDITCDNLGTVISQNPRAGVTARPGSAVAIAIGKPPGKPCP